MFKRPNESSLTELIQKIETYEMSSKKKISRDWKLMLNSLAPRVQDQLVLFNTMYSEDTAIINLIKFFSECTNQYNLQSMVSNYCSAPLKFDITGSNVFNKQIKDEEEILIKTEDIETIEKPILDNNEEKLEHISEVKNLVDTLKNATSENKDEDILKQETTPIEEIENSNSDEETKNENTHDFEKNMLDNISSLIGNLGDETETNNSLDSSIVLNEEIIVKDIETELGEKIPTGNLRDELSEKDEEEVLIEDNDTEESISNDADETKIDEKLSVKKSKKVLKPKEENK